MTTSLPPLSSGEIDDKLTANVNDKMLVTTHSSRCVASADAEAC